MFHKISGLGRLGHSVHIKEVGGKKLAEFNVATQFSKNSPTIWMKLSAWDKLADLCESMLRKGSAVYFEGSLQTDKEGKLRAYVNRDGVPAANIDVRVSFIRMMSNPAGQSLGESPVEYVGSMAKEDDLGALDFNTIEEIDFGLDRSELDELVSSSEVF